jgi:hypothetical protein
MAKGALHDGITVAASAVYAILPRSRIDPALLILGGARIGQFGVK